MGQKRQQISVKPDGELQGCVTKLFPELIV